MPPLARSHSPQPSLPTLLCSVPVVSRMWPWSGAGSPWISSRVRAPFWSFSTGTWCSARSPCSCCFHTRQAKIRDGSQAGLPHSWSSGLHFHPLRNPLHFVTKSLRNDGKIYPHTAGRAGAEGLGCLPLGGGMCPSGVSVTAAPGPYSEPLSQKFNPSAAPESATGASLPSTTKKPPMGDISSLLLTAQSSQIPIQAPALPRKPPKVPVPWC